ncbi:hypothetical protein EVAR_77765_1 [Eumeta japonica]|uniref:Uncharacterized protein n=1 Tax=Eumeta variegata TaxID=151549 RepID=A0A4C1TE11_EUMVA|nr:hypothetical protein EVAR_77765_1 [Eumeta japonica]
MRMTVLTAGTTQIHINKTITQRRHIQRNTTKIVFIGKRPRRRPKGTGRSRLRPPKRGSADTDGRLQKDGTTRRRRVRCGCSVPRARAQCYVQEYSKTV